MISHMTRSTDPMCMWTSVSTICLKHKETAGRNCLPRILIRPMLPFALFPLPGVATRPCRM
jgi:hypothetical protein